MGVVERIRAKQFAQVERGGLTFRLRRVTSRDLLDRGCALILACGAKPAQSAVSADDAVSLLRSSGEYVAAVVVASVAAIRSSDAEAWEDWAVVLDEADEELTAGRIWIGSLPDGAAAVIYDAAITHSGGGEGAAALPAFLRACAAASRPPG